MDDTLSTALTIAAATGAGITGGVYVAFSAMVMPALRKRPAGEAITTMGAINEMAVRAPFMTLFFGGALAAAAVIVTQIVGNEAAGVDLTRTLGAALALAGFVTTIAVNVPRNNVLASAAIARSASAHGNAESADKVWHGFDRIWSRANHVRGVVTMLGAIALTASLTY